VDVQTWVSERVSRDLYARAFVSACIEADVVHSSHPATNDMPDGRTDAVEPSTNRGDDDIGAHTCDVSAGFAL
jgi:hypothetical protein